MPSGARAQAVPHHRPGRGLRGARHGGRGARRSCRGLTAVPSRTPEPAATVVLRLPPSAAHVRTARLVAAAMARHSGVEEALLDEIRLAVGEACARAVRLHEQAGVAEPVTVEFSDRGRFAVSVIDSAPARGAPVPPVIGPRSSTAPDADRAAVVAAAAPVDPSAEALGLALLGAVVP